MSSNRCHFFVTLAQPENLEKLCLEAIGKYFCDLWYNFEPHLNDDRSEEQEQTLSVHVQKLKFTYRNFHRLLTENVPITLANDVTNKLLSCIDSLGIMIDRNELEEEIYEELIKCVIHPGVTRIAPKMDLLGDSDTFPHNWICSDIFLEGEFDSSVLVRLLVKNVSCLNNLKSLNLKYYLHQEYDFTYDEFPPFLEEFCGFCNDESLKEIARSCRFMKALNLFDQMGITDCSIASILLMDNLEKLNIANTAITEEGYVDLLKGLIKKGETSKLNCLVLSECNGEILRILEALPRLKISLLLDCEDWHDLSSLKNVHGLNVDTSLTDSHKILRNIGRHLVYLHVYISNNANAEDVLLIGQYCTSLQCLHFSGCVYNITIHWKIT
ncbi:hypothetical protein L9F63_022140 [Diploptera punctata]|uniref:Uncharacterized protein n=1 Tax=Diploptera punctata TaxID=6984 RepID=A0AAD7ZN76_DIPPU|nr:hypothetical protein L9F63_022140 [Diploptera punctata]